MRCVVFGHAAETGGAKEAFFRLLDFLENEPDVRVASIPLVRKPENCEPILDRTRIASIPNESSKIGKIRATMFAAWRLRSFQPTSFISVGLATSSLLLARLAGSNVRRIAYDFIADRSPQCPLLKASFGSFDDFVVQSPSMRDRLVGLGFPSERIASLPCFPGDDFPQLVKIEASISRGLKRLAYFGRLAVNKGLPEFIDALSSPNLAQSVIFEIWGEGADDQRISAAIKQHGMEDRVVLKGRYPSGAAALRLMASYDALVMPSQHTEGVPLVLIEAMSVGLPALCTDVGAMRDVCVSNPDFVMCGKDREGLVDGIRTLIARFAAGELNSARLRAYYDKSFGLAAVGTSWRAFLQTPSLKGRRW